MKRFCSLILMCLFATTVAAQVIIDPCCKEDEKELGFWFEGRIDSKNESQLVGWYEREITDMFGVYALVSLENTDRYRQGYAGITMKPLPNLLPWLQIGAGIGRERDSESSGVRKNLFVSVDSEKIEGFATYENGMTGPWHRWNAVYHVTDKISVGAMQETNLGLAPRAEYHIKKNLTVWGVVFRDRVVVGIFASF